PLARSAANDRPTGLLEQFVRLGADRGRAMPPSRYSPSASPANVSVGYSMSGQRGCLIMNKRTFLGLSAAILGGFPTRRLFGRGADDPPSPGQLTNWAGNYRYSTGNLVAFTSVEEVRSYVRGHD